MIPFFFPPLGYSFSLFKVCNPLYKTRTYIDLHTYIFFTYAHIHTFTHTSLAHSQREREGEMHASTHIHFTFPTYLSVIKLFSIHIQDKRLSHIFCFSLTASLSLYYTRAHLSTYFSHHKTRLNSTTAAPRFPIFPYRRPGLPLLSAATVCFTQRL